MLSVRERRGREQWILNGVLLYFLRRRPNLSFALSSLRQDRERDVLDALQSAFCKLRVLRTVSRLQRRRRRGEARALAQLERALDGDLRDKDRQLQAAWTKQRVEE